MGHLCTTGSKCPLHRENYIESVCIHPRCIEPLCPKCLANHLQQHKAIGTPPVLRPIAQLMSSLAETAQIEAEMYHKNIEFSQPVRKLSTAQIIKQYTREYFLKRRPALSKQKEIPITDLLGSIEMTQKLKDPNAQQALRNFLKKNIEANHEVVDKQYGIMY